jgi:hypothetical protein
MSSGFLANLVATTVLAPLERWKIIKQTQMSYDYRPKDKMTSFLNFLSSNCLLRQRPPVSKGSSPCGEATQPTCGCRDGR